MEQRIHEVAHPMDRGSMGQVTLWGRTSMGLDALQTGHPWGRTPYRVEDPWEVGYPME